MAINFLGGYRNTMTLVLTGLDIEDKAAWAEQELFGLLGGREQFADVDVRLLRFDRPDAPTNEQATAHLRITVKDPDPRKVGRRFSDADHGAGPRRLRRVPHHDAARRRRAPTASTGRRSCPADAVVRARGAILPGRQHPPVAPAAPRTRRVRRPSPARRAAAGRPRAGAPPAADAAAGAAARAGLRRPLRRQGRQRQRRHLGPRPTPPTPGCAPTSPSTGVRELLPEAAALEVRRFELPNLGALNFVIVGLLGEGVAASTRPDPQAKGLGEYLRSRAVRSPQPCWTGCP